MLCAGGSATLARPVDQTISAPSLSLEGQTTWVTPGGQFSLRVNARNLRLNQDRLVIEVFPRLVSRAELALSFHGQQIGPPLVTSPPLALNRFATSRGTLTITVATAGKPPASGAAALTVGGNGDCAALCPGVYPVSIQLVQGSTGAGLASLTTQMVVAPKSATPLHFAWVLPISAPPKIATDGRLSLAKPARTQIAAEIHSLLPGPGGAPTLDASPSTLAALAQQRSKTSRDALAGLTAWSALPGHSVLQSPFASLDMSSVARSRLGWTVQNQMSMGESTLHRLIGVTGTPGSWVVTRGLDWAGLVLLPPQVIHVVMPSADLVQQDYNLTPDRPFLVGGRPRTVGMTSDAGLAGLLPGPHASAVVAAQQVAASLAQIYFEAPNSPRRGVILAVPPTWNPRPAFLDHLQSALATSPVVRDSTLGGFFASLPLQTQGSQTLVRVLARPSHRAAPLPSAQILADQRTLAALGSMTPGDPAALNPLREVLALAEDGRFQPRGRKAALAGFTGAEQRFIGNPTLSGDHTLTLTSRTGLIPLTLSTSATSPLHAVIEVNSDKLIFPSGARQNISLRAHNKTVSFLVKARTTGDFPLHVKVLSPKGNLVLLQQTLTVRSTAVSAVGVALTAAALVVLLSWWARSIALGRRARNKHLIDPTG